MRILIADDDIAIHEFYGKVIEDYFNDYDVVTAYTGDIAVNRYLESVDEHRPFDLVIMDVGHDGYEASAQILTDHPNAVIALVSDYPDWEEASSINFAEVCRKEVEPHRIRDMITSLVFRNTLAEIDDALDDPASLDDADSILDILKDTEDLELSETLTEARVGLQDELRTSRISGMRKLCDVLDANPNILLPYEFKNGTTIYILENEQSQEQMTVTRRAIGGKWDKEVYNDAFTLKGSIDGLAVKLYTNRGNVCQRIVTGSREVTEEVPDPELVAQVPLKRVTRTVEDVEWVCPESLLAD